MHATCMEFLVQMLADGRPSAPNIVGVLAASEPKEVVVVVRGKANKKKSIRAYKLLETRESG